MKIKPKTMLLSANRDQRPSQQHRYDRDAQGCAGHVRLLDALRLLSRDPAQVDRQLLALLEESLEHLRLRCHVNGRCHSLSHYW